MHLAGRPQKRPSAFAAPDLRARGSECVRTSKEAEASRRWAAARKAAQREVTHGAESDGSMPGLKTPSDTSSAETAGEDRGGSTLFAAYARARALRGKRRKAKALKKEGTSSGYYARGAQRRSKAVASAPTTKAWAPFAKALSAERMQAAFENGEELPPSAPPQARSLQDATETPRQQELRVREEMRRIGNAASKSLLTAKAASELRRRTVEKVQSFFIDEGHADAAPSVVDGLLRRARTELVPLHRADLTWAKYAPSWKRARAFIRAAVEADGRVFCAATLRSDQRYVTAAALWCFYTTTAATSVETMVGAIRMAMRVNSIPIADDFMTSVVRSVCRRQRALPVRKRVNITFDEVSKIAKKWGGDNAPTPHLMIAAAMVVGFTLLLRYSDLTVISIDGLFFAPEGIAVYIPCRKNRQAAGGSWLPLADTKRNHGAVAIVKRLLARLGIFVPDGFRGQLNVRAFLFRDIVPTSGHKFASVRHDRVVGEGRFPLGRKAYGHYLTRFREAIRCCCGYTRTQAMEFGTQSLRSGGNTHLFNNKVPQDIRMVLGQWRTPSVEEGYVRSMLSSRFEMMAAIGL